MKERDLNNINISKSAYIPKNKYTKIKNVIGWDTETEKGKCFLLGYYNNENDKDIIDSNDNYDFFEFINKKKFKSTINFFYNITYDFQALTKGLPIKNLKELAKVEMTRYEDFLIKILPNKFLGIGKIKNNKLSKKGFTRFFDLAQFYNHMKLTDSANKFLGYGKTDLKEEGINITKLSYDRYLNDMEYKSILKKYLFRDIEITKKLGENLNNMLKNYLIPKSYYSQASFSEQYFLENLPKRINLPSKNILQLALNCYQGGRFEVLQKGYFKKAFIYDIKSAYPEMNVKIPDLSKGEWKQNKEYEPESLISLFKVNTDIYDIKISPSKYQIKSGLLTYPIGKFKELYLNKKEYESIINMGFKINIEKAYHYFDNEPEYPFTFLEKFYYLKEELKHQNKKELSWIPKIIINGFYGKNIQIIPEFNYTKEYQGDKNLNDVLIINNKKIYQYKTFKAGRLFNPIVANEITANTRVKLFESIKGKENNIIGFQTDSIISSKPLNLKMGNKLGDWELENKGEMIILGSGLYQILGDKPKLRVRGFSRNLNLIKLLNKNLQKQYIKVHLKRNIKLKRVMKLKISDDEKERRLNQIFKEVKNININFDIKRKWKRKFKNCKDVLENTISSLPLEI